MLENAHFSTEKPQASPNVGPEWLTPLMWLCWVMFATSDPLGKILALHLSMYAIYIRYDLTLY